MSKEIFKKKINEFLEAGVLKEIFSTTDFSVFNISNYCYGVFDYNEYSVGQCGIIVNPETMREIINDPDFFPRFVQAMGTEWIKKNTIILNENNLEVMKRMKKETDMNGPTSDIDVELENKLLGPQKNR